MTALAMIIGMIPMSLGLGEGGEQNAPLGRAVIGGLLFATFATLFFVPVVFRLVHGRNPRAGRPDYFGRVRCSHERRTFSSTRNRPLRRRRHRRRALRGLRGRRASEGARTRLRQTTLEQAAPLVTVVRPDTGDPTSELVLPGNVEAFTDAAIHARTNGYVKAWYADIGTVVAKGQKLADIETPEVDQQLQQANAQLQTAIANEQLARRHGRSGSRS